MPPEKANFDLLVRADRNHLKPLKGSFAVPPDKSISHRALILAALAQGTSHLANLLAGEDVRCTLEALRQLGVRADITEESPDNGAFSLTLEGIGARGAKTPEAPLDMGNSGTGMRLLAGLLCGLNIRATLIGDASLMRRPMSRIVEPLRSMGADIRCQPDGTPPLQIHPKSRPLEGIEYRLPVASAQVKSAVLLAGLGARGDTLVKEPVQRLSRDHTERLLRAQKRLRISQQQTGATLWQHATVSGGGTPLSPLNMRIPGDMSSAAFVLLAGFLRPGSELLLPQICVNPTRSGIVAKLSTMGAQIEYTNAGQSSGEPLADLVLSATRKPAEPCTVVGDEVPALIDEIPALAVAGLFSRGGLGVSGAEELKHKESDRLAVLLRQLRRLAPGARIVPNENEDGFSIRTDHTDPVMTGGEIDSNGDHRIAMAFACAAPMDGDLRIRNCACIATSFPGFVDGMQRLGVDLTPLPEARQSA